MGSETKEKFLNQDNSDIDGSSMAAATKNYQQGNYREALQILLSIANRNPDASVLTDIGNCYYMLDSQKEALEYWQKAINLDSKSFKTYTNIGNLYYKNKQTEKAISYWLIALILRPEDAQTSRNLAVAFDKKNMRFEAIKYFEKYIKYEEETSSKDYLEVKNKLTHCYNVANQYLVLGAQLQSQGDLKKASACYFKSLANYPNISKTNLNLGSIFFEDKNLDLAIKYWKVASHLEPNYDKVYSNLAICYDFKRQFDYAYAYYYLYGNFVINDKEEYYKVNSRLQKIKVYLNDHKDLIDKHLELAKEHIANSEIYEAIDEFKVYSILKPEEQKQYKEVIGKLESYINPEFSIIASCFEIGNNLMQEGKFSEAKHYFWRIMKLSSPQYLEFTKARAKYTQCEKSEAI